MKLNPSGLGIAAAVFFGLTAFAVALLNFVFPGYGTAFLRVLDSIYPGYTFGKWGFMGVIVVTGYAIVDGFIAGFIFGWLYNFFGGKKE